MTQKIFKDNATDYIMAMDFDGTITTKNIFPDIAPIRRYAKEVINFLYDIGVKMSIWTCRDKTSEHDHQGPMVEFLGENGVKYHSINSTVEFAPFFYEARKVYAHMYVDDKGFGWMEYDDIMLAVLYQFMVAVMHVPSDMATLICNKIKNGYEIDEKDIRMVRSLMRRCNE